MARRGIHSKPNQGESVEWITPRDLLAALGRFDLDPCAHPQQPWPTAMTMIKPPKCGLQWDWIGRVWLNPPFGTGIDAWLYKMVQHNNGIALVPARTDVEKWFWPYIWERADAVYFLRGRLRFHKPDGSTQGNAGHGTVLAAYGKQNVTALAALPVHGWRGRLIELK